MSADSDLKKAVLDELGWEPSVNAAHIGVTADRGVITLTDHVDSLANKVSAEKAASRVKGVRGVAEEIEVKLPWEIKRGDEELATAAIGRFSWNSLIPADALKVKVSKGWVTLKGTVAWQFEKEAAEQDIRTLSGVIGVSNEIEVRPAVNASNVKDAIERALHRSWYYEPDTIVVSAVGGKITLTGSVGAWNARRLAGSTAWSAPGAISVVNDIVVNG